MTGGVSGQPMDEEGFEQLFASHFPDVWRFARRRTATTEDADDVTAETFAVAWRRRGEVPAAEARPWLFGVARNVLSNHWRSGERRTRLQSRLVESALTWSEVAEDRIQEKTLWLALASLSEDDRDLLIMRAWDELAVTEIAAVLGCTPNAASSRLHKARRRLAAELQRQEAGSDGHVVVNPRLTERSDREH